MSGNGRAREGVPSWDGNASSYQEYDESALLWEQSVAFQKRYLCGPKLAAELTGAARRLVAGRHPEWLSHNDGVRRLTDHLRASLGKPQLSELTEQLSRFFKGSRRRAGENINDYITRKNEIYMRACQALQRVAPHQAGTTRPPARTPSSEWSSTWPGSRRSSFTSVNSEPLAEASNTGASVSAAEGSATTAPEDEAERTNQTGWGDQDWNGWQHPWQTGWWQGSWQWGYSGASSWDSWWQRDEPRMMQVPELLPDYVQGWYLLHDSGLTSQCAVLDGAKRDFTNYKNTSYLSDIPEELTEEEQEPSMAGEDLEDDEQVLWGEAEKEAQEAMAAMQHARNTLKQARLKQHNVKLSRQYFKTKTSTSSSTSSRDDSKMTCLRSAELGSQLPGASVLSQSGRDSGRFVLLHLLQ